MMLLGSKAKRSHIVVVLSLIATALVSTGCPGGGVPPAPPQEFYEAPVITSDGAGGIIVFYAAQEGWDYWCLKRRLYVQRVDKEGDFLWGKGVLIGKGYTRLAPDVQPAVFLGPLAMRIVSDGSGGAIVVWRALCPEGIDAIRLARVSPQGEILWQREFRRRREPRFLHPVPLLALSDGTGGIIITWCCVEDDLLRSQRIDSEGQFLWGENGVVVSEEPAFRYDAVVNEKGALIVVWPRDETILAQKISSQGEPLWPEGGVQVATLAHTAPQITNDGQAGAIITWIRWHLREDYTVGGWEVLAQRIDPEGDLLWRHGGVPVFRMERPVLPHHPPSANVMSSRSGEAIITHLVPFHGLLAQKIDCEGSLQWQEGGVFVRRFRKGLHVSTVADNYGGAIFVIGHFDRERTRYLLHAYRLNAEGKVLWRGVSVTTARGGRFSRTPDGHGGVFVAWAAYEFGPLRPYIQRICAEGEPRWGGKGILLNL